MKRLYALFAALAFVSSTAVPVASAAADAYTGHQQTATVSCSGGSGFVVDGNALFGQQTETAAWNAGNHGTTCSATLTP